jgi:GNAT superfamily N-acetyltransferase
VSEAQPIVVRRAGAPDVADLARIQLVTALHAYRHIFPEDAPKPTHEALRRRWAEVLAQGALFAAEACGEVVGAIHAADLGTRGGPGRLSVVGEIGGLYVLPQWWRSGIGATLHDVALDHLRSLGVGTAELWVLSENTSVRRWYERRGWRLLEGVTRTVAGPVFDVRYQRSLT